MLIANRRLKTEQGVVEPGEPLPQAETWRNLQAYIDFGYVTRAPDPVPAKAKAKTPAEPAPTAKAAPEPASDAKPEPETAKGA